MQVAPIGARFGGFWIRVVAALIDFIAVGIVTTPISFIISGITKIAGHAVAIPKPGVDLASFLITMSFSTLVNWLCAALLESSSYQATLGKMAVGLKVTDIKGLRVSFARASGRHFAKILSTLMLFVGFVMVGLTRYKQGLHDLIAGTLVMKSL